MNQVVIFFVPTGASQRDFDAAWREHFAAAQNEEVPQPKAKNIQPEITDNDQMPLWTWFISKACL